MTTEIHSAIQALKSAHVKSIESELVELDKMMSQYLLFWRNLDLALHVLKQKLDALLAILPQTANVKIRDRFLVRLEEFRVLWNGVVVLCERIASVHQVRAGNTVLLDDAS